MIRFANAKINLGLFILSKREDGYHDIASLKYPIPLNDVLEILPSNTFQLEVIGKEIAGDLKDNLIWKAYSLLQEEFNIGPVRILLEKHIPMGAGLGGGSSDATFVLKGLNAYFDLKLSDDKLRALAGKLGSDCPFFVANVPQIASGKGEILQPIEFSLKGHYLYLVHPDIHVSTAQAYANVQALESEMDWSELQKFDFEFWREKLKNDFEKSVFGQYPEIEALKTKLYAHGAEFVAMSGSGSSVFGVFKKKPERMDLAYPSQFILEL